MGTSSLGIKSFEREVWYMLKAPLNYYCSNTAVYSVLSYAQQWELDSSTLGGSSRFVLSTVNLLCMIACSLFRRGASPFLWTRYLPPGAGCKLAQWLMYVILRYV